MQSSFAACVVGMVRLADQLKRRRWQEERRKRRGDEERERDDAVS